MVVTVCNKLERLSPGKKVTGVEVSGKVEVTWPYN